MYDPKDPNLFAYTDADVKFGDGASSEPEDEWDEEYDCPFAEHMVTIDMPGLFIIIGLGGGLFVLTIILSFFSYRKWRQVSIHLINEPVVRSW